MPPHEVLDVRPGASRREVTAAFRRFALSHHPDRGGDPARFHAGVEAYRQLTGGDPPPTGTAPSNVVFYRRPSLLRVARRRLATFRFRH